MAPDSGTGPRESLAWRTRRSVWHQSGRSALQRPALRQHFRRRGRRHVLGDLVPTQRAPRRLRPCALRRAYRAGPSQSQIARTTLSRGYRRALETAQAKRHAPSITQRRLGQKLNEVQDKTGAFLLPPKDMDVQIREPLDGDIDDVIVRLSQHVVGAKHQPATILDDA